MPILLQVGKGENREPAGTGLTRIYPIDKYDVPPVILERASKYHLLRVPVLGQHNTHDRGGDWCGRTSSCMVWCYRRLATGQVSAKADYITHWDNRDGKGMELRLPDPSQIACKNYDLGSTLKMVEVTIPEDSYHRIFPLDGSRTARVKKAAQIASSEPEVEKLLGPVLSNLLNNNPMVFYSGFSTGRKFKSHIIVISGFCYLMEDGQPRLWLQITDPAPPKVGSIFSPPRDKDRPIEALRSQRDLDYLLYLKARDDIIRFHYGDWADAEGFVYLLRARKLFEQNSVFPQDNVLWMDYMYYNGARAGGLFSDCSEETPYDEIFVRSNCYNNLCFPLQENADKLDSPLACYERCEMPPELGSQPAPAPRSSTPSSGSAPRVRPSRTHDGWGGYYPLGTNSTVHGGVHLLSQKSIPIRCMAPGYIVAARLRKEPQTGGWDFEKRFLNAYSGFVLVRHDLVVPTQGGAKEFPFYSLYMHLSPTTWPDSKDEYAKVEWLKRFYLARHNAVVNLDPTRGAVGERHWLAVPPATSGAKADRVDLVDEADIFGPRISRWVRDRQDHRYLSYVKEPPGNLKAAYDALKRGDVVTFSKPLLQVSPGDILGWCKPVGQTTDTRTNLLSGYLHWEVFAPAAPSPSAFEKIKELLAASARGVDLHPVVDPVADNFWTQGELRQQLDPLLPAADRQELAKIIEVAIPDNKSEPPAPELAESIRDFFSGRATFFDEPDGTQRPPDQLPPCNYQLTVRIDNAKFPLPAPPSGDYAFVVTYYGESSEKLGTQRLTVGARRNANPIEDTLTVPPGTMRIGIDTYGFFLDPGEPVAPGELYALAKKSASHKWRNVLLRHVTEWSKGSIDGLLTKLKSVGLLPQNENTEPYLGCAWYGVDPASETQLGEHAVVSPDGSSSSLFGNQDGKLPTDGRIDNLNPVTLLWALKLLQSEAANPRVCSLKSGWEILRSQQPAEPEFFGWFDDGSRPLRVGHPLWAVAIRSGYDETPISFKAQRVSSGGAAQNAAPTEVELGGGHYAEGMFALRVGTPLWGKWELKVVEYPNTSSPGQEMDPPGPVDIEAPEMSPTFHMEKDPKSGWYKLSLQFTQNCPDALYGFVAFEYLLVDVDARFPQAARWILDRATGQFVVGLMDGSDKNVTASYTLQAYFEKYEAAISAESSDSSDIPDEEAPERPRVAMKACKAVQLVCNAYADANAHKLPSLEVISVTTDGLQVKLHLENDDEADGLAAAVSSFAGTDAGPLSTEAAFDKNSGELTVTARVSEGWKRWDKCVPVLGESAAGNEKVVHDEKGLISGPRAGFGDDVRVSANFTLHDYIQAFDRGDERPATGFRVSPNLVAAVQKLRDRFGPGQWINLKPGNIEFDDGGLWSIEIRSARIAQRDLLATANRLKAANPSLFEEVAAVGRSGVVLRVRHDPTVVTAGQLEIEFDPAEAFGGLLHDVEFDDTKVLQVRAEFITRNALPPPAFPEALNAPLMDLRPDDGPLKDVRKRLDAFAGKELDVQTGDWLQARSLDIFKRLARPAFDEIGFSMNKNTLVVKVMLKGSAKDWTNADPAIYAVLADNSERLLPRNLVTHTANQVTLVADLYLIRPEGNAWVPDEAIVGQDTGFVARPRNADAVFDMERLQVHERRYLPRNIKPRMASFEMNPARNSLVFTAKLEDFPTHQPIRVRGVDDVTGKDVKLAVRYAIPLKDKDGALIGGLCNANGVFSATVVKSQLPSGHAVKFTARPVSNAVLGIARDEIAPPELNRAWTRASPPGTSTQPGKSP